MRALQILVPLVVSAVTLTFVCMPIDWCEVPHRRDLGALIAFVAFVAFLVLADSGKAGVSTSARVLIGALCGLAIALVFASGPAGLVLGVCVGVALGRFGLDWAA